MENSPHATCSIPPHMGDFSTKHCLYCPKIDSVRYGMAPMLACLGNWLTPKEPILIARIVTIFTPKSLICELLLFPAFQRSNSARPLNVFVLFHIIWLSIKLSYENWTVHLCYRSMPFSLRNSSSAIHLFQLRNYSFAQYTFSFYSFFTPSCSDVWLGNTLGRLTTRENLLFSHIQNF